MDAEHSADNIESLREKLRRTELSLGGRLAIQTQLHEAAKARVAELEAQINTPELHDFAKAVALEAAHQRQRWPSEHDAGKTDADWFWLIGYLAGKALHNPPNAMPPQDAKLHRIVTVAAAAANWHAAVSGASTTMRPGIETPVDA